MIWKMRESNFGSRSFGTTLKVCEFGVGISEPSAPNRMRKKFHGGKRPNAGRPRAGRIAFPLRLKPEIAALIDRKCFENGCSRGEIVEDKFGADFARPF